MSGSVDRRRLLLLLLGAAIVLVLWLRTGWAGLVHQLRNVHPGWLTGALLLLGVQVCLGALRWRVVAKRAVPLPLGRASLQVLSAEALNALLPSRTGDLAKGVFLTRERRPVPMRLGVGLAAFEKWIDTTAFAVLVVAMALLHPFLDRAGWLLVAGAAVLAAGLSSVLFRPIARRLSNAQPVAQRGPWRWVRRTAGEAGALVESFRAAPGRIGGVFVLSASMWLLLLLQVSWVLRALGLSHAETPLLWSRSLLAIFVGMLPLTPGGIGTRDAALLYFLGPAIGPAAALGLGAFLSLRYVLLAAVGALVLQFSAYTVPPTARARTR